MRVGVFFDGFSSTAEMLDIARGAEAAGAESLWFAQHMGYRDALVWAAVAAQATRSVALVPTAITPYMWPPLPAAMAMATLGEIAPERVRLAVSVGNLLNLSESGYEPVAPIRVMREYVETLRALHDGEAVHREGRVHHLRGAKMAFDAGPRYPLYIASTGPQMLRLAGEIGDGVLLSAGLTLVSCHNCLADAQAGLGTRDPAALRRAAFINFRASRDGAAAKVAVLRKLAFLFRNRGHADNIKSSGLDIDHEKIIQRHREHDLDGATKLLPIAAANVFAVAGTPAECAERLAEYLAVGIDEPIIEVGGSAEERALALDVVRDVAGR
jgi:5,10-methylenetetrahydromethanopterin reductase